MAKNWFLWASVWAAAMAAAGAMAQDSAIVSGDTAAGQKLYEEQCTVCHGVGGASIIPAQPILAGQHAEYTAEQLRQFRDQHRKNAAMAPFAANLSDDDIANLAAYLASRPPVIAGADNAELAKQGEKLYRGGDFAGGAPACAACHGPTGAGIAPHYPRISGQHAVYVASSLREYASGTRQDEAMSTIASRLSEEQINALAAYIAGLAP